MAMTLEHAPAWLEACMHGWVQRLSGEIDAMYEYIDDDLAKLSPLD
jgi:hypothetical protein